MWLNDRVVISASLYIKGDEINVLKVPASYILRSPYINGKNKL